MNRVPRSRGALSGLMLILLGGWAALAPFVGPYADFGFSPADRPWIWTEGRGLFEVLPGVVALLAGIVLLLSASRAAGVFAASLGVAAGAWLVVGPTVAPLLDGPEVGTALGDANRQVAEVLAFFTGVGVLIVLFAALALGRFAVVGVREARQAEKETVVFERDLSEIDDHRDPATRDGDTVERPHWTDEKHDAYADTRDDLPVRDRKVAGEPEVHGDRPDHDRPVAGDDRFVGNARADR